MHSRNFARRVPRYNFEKNNIQNFKHRYFGITMIFKYVYLYNKYANLHQYVAKFFQKKVPEYSLFFELPKIKGIHLSINRFRTASKGKGFQSF